MASNDFSDRVAVMENDISYIKKSIDEIKYVLKEQTKNFITRSEFEPVKNGFYGITTFLIFALLTALIAQVI